MQAEFTEPFDYEVITDDAEHFAIHAYTCDYDKIKIANNVL